MLVRVVAVGGGGGVVVAKKESRLCRQRGILRQNDHASLPKSREILDKCRKSMHFAEISRNISGGPCRGASIGVSPPRRAHSKKKNRCAPPKKTLKRFLIKYKGENQPSSPSPSPQPEPQPEPPARAPSPSSSPTPPLLHHNLSAQFLIFF